MSQAPDVSKLFSPWSIHRLTLPNRIVMAPMTRGFSPGGVPTPEVAAYYRRRAEGGVGLIVTEGTGIDRPRALHRDSYPRFHGQAALDGWRAVVDAVHQAGGRIAPQLWHMGGATEVPDPLGQVDMPSEVERPGHLRVRPMSEQAIADTISAYASAARDAQALGFDAVELHGAHGYLLHQFFNADTNLRAAPWGGPTHGERSRFAREVVRAVRQAVGPDFPLLLRISQWNMADYGARLAHTPGELEDWLGPLADAGVDVFHASQRRYWEPTFEGSPLNLAGWARRLTGKPSITVGSVGLSGEFMAGSREQVARASGIGELIERLDRDEFDLVAVGRALIQDPQWALKVREGRSEELQAYEAANLQFLR